MPKLRFAIEIAALKLLLTPLPQAPIRESGTRIAFFGRHSRSKGFDSY
jgi:hypothetical protein